MRVRFAFAGQEFTVTLEDNPSARDLFSLLPLDLKISDYATNEKIAYLPRKLTEDGGGRFDGEAIGDLCYYAPWGNLAMFHGPITLQAGEEKVSVAAWKTLPSWSIYGARDLAIPPAALAFMAERAQARKVQVVPGASHVVMVSHPREVAGMIEQAATATR